METDRTRTPSSSSVESAAGQQHKSAAAGVGSAAACASPKHAPPSVDGVPLRPMRRCRGTKRSRLVEEV